MSEDIKPRVFSPVTTFPLKISLPQIYPETAERPFTFYMRVQLVADAERAQKEFIMLPDVEQRGDEFHKFDVAMIASLSVKAPENFPDFPEINGQPLAEVIRDYFIPSNDSERREGMRFICRRVMAQYWKAVQPSEYL